MMRPRAGLSTEGLSRFGIEGEQGGLGDPGHVDRLREGQVHSLDRLRSAPMLSRVFF
jgi:hypothetical protein